MTSTETKMNSTITKETAFAVLDGTRCCRCLSVITDETKIELTNADWCVDYDTTPCSKCWTEKEEEEGDGDLVVKWAEEFEAVWDKLMEFEEDYRKERKLDEE